MCDYMQNQMDNLIENGLQRHENAFNALLSYELNLLDGKKPKRGEFMEDYAVNYGTTVKEMKIVELEVEKYMQNNGFL